MQMTARSWIPRSEALARLRVKSQTLYAYVSRGRIAARPDPADPRRSLYAAEDVARLLDRSQPRPPPAPRPGRRVGRGEAMIDSRLTAVTDATVLYRGRDAAELSRAATLEQTARLLWDCGETDPFADLRPRVDVVFPGGPRARLFAGLARRADEDGPSTGRGAASLRREAAALLNELVDAVAGPGPRLPLHQRLARAWKADDRATQLLRRALVLSADHELDAATLAARVAAGAGASLAASALAGLAALSGPELGGRLAQVGAFVVEARKSDARTAARARLAEGREIPGFGHPLHPPGDPRAAALLAGSGLPDELMDVVRVGEGLTGRPPAFELALALVARRLDLPRDGAFALLAIGRTVGWLAHAMEQAASGSPIRARLRYVGDEPDVE